MSVSMAPPKLSPASTSTLQTHKETLHMLFYRNKNQHRRSAWWRRFASFRRELARLLSELSELDSLDPSAGATAKKNDKEKVKTVSGSGPGSGGDRPKSKLSAEQRRTRRAEVEKRVGARMEAWRDVFVPQWHLAFSQLVAQKQFAQLGLVLLSILAQTASVLGIVAAYEAMPERRKVGERMAELAGRDVEGLVGEQALGGDGEGEFEDLGTVIRRDENKDMEDSSEDE